MEVKKLRILRVIELIIQGVEAEPKSQQKKTFKRIPQQDKWYKERAYIKYKKQRHFIKDYRRG